MIFEGINFKMTSQNIHSLKNLKNDPYQRLQEKFNTVIKAFHHLLNSEIFYLLPGISQINWFKSNHKKS